MKNFIALLTAVFFFQLCSAQELNFLPVKYKEAPVEAVNFLKYEKLKAKKAKWFFAQPGVFLADFQKGNQSKVAYYFLSNGHLLYKRVPIKPSEVPKGIIDVMGSRVNSEGNKIYLFKGNEVQAYCFMFPTQNNTYVTKYFTANGNDYDMKFKEYLH